MGAIQSDIFSILRIYRSIVITSRPYHTKLPANVQDATRLLATSPRVRSRVPILKILLLHVYGVASGVHEGASLE